MWGGDVTRHEMHWNGSTLSPQGGDRDCVASVIGGPGCVAARIGMRRGTTMLSPVAVIGRSL
jgi:hypothetical protein